MGVVLGRIPAPAAAAILSIHHKANAKSRRKLCSRNCSQKLMASATACRSLLPSMLAHRMRLVTMTATMLTTMNLRIQWLILDIDIGLQ